MTLSQMSFGASRLFEQNKSPAKWCLYHHICVTFFWNRLSQDRLYSGLQDKSVFLLLVDFFCVFIFLTVIKYLSMCACLSWSFVGVWADKWLRDVWRTYLIYAQCKIFSSSLLIACFYLAEWCPCSRPATIKGEEGTIFNITGKCSFLGWLNKIFSLFLYILTG